MSEKDINGFKYAIIFLSGIIIMLVGYLVYDIFFVDNNNFKEDNWLNLDNFSKYNNYDDTYATMRSLMFVSEEGKRYTINMGLDGSVYTGMYNGRKDITNIANAIDIVSFEAASGLIRDYKCYILTNSGRVYLYRLSDMLNNKYEAMLMSDISNVKKIMKLEHANSANASSSWTVVAVLEDGSVIELDSDNG